MPNTDMDPIQININIGLQKESIEVFKQVAMAAIYGFISHAAQNDTEAEAAKEPKPAAKPTAKPTAKAVEPTKTKTKQVMPSEPSKPVESTEISDQSLLDLVKQVKDAKVPPKEIKDVFKELGIASSTACPQEKRAELVVKLSNLLPVEASEDLPE